MTPAPLLPNHLSKQDEPFGDAMCDVSLSSGASYIDEMKDFDPNAVDFEPLLVSNTGRILTYHSASFYEDAESISITSSMKTPIVSNLKQRRNNILKSECLRDSIACASSRFTRSFLLSLVVAWGLSSFAIHSNSYNARGLETTIAKNLGNHSNSGVKLHQLMMNVDVAVSEASASHLVYLVFWEPYLDHAGSSENKILAVNSMAIISQCFRRLTFSLRLDEIGTYQLQPIESTQQRKLLALNSTQTIIDTAPSNNLPMTIFASNFEKAAIEIFDRFHQGAFVTIFHDPVEIYLELYLRQQGGFYDSVNNDNLLVRQLSGLGVATRQVDVGDYKLAKRVLMSKFVIGSCDDPTETLRRFVKMIGNEGSNVGSEQCAAERQRWIEACGKMKDMGQRSKDDQSNFQILTHIKAKHHFDIQLYEDSKKVFLQQTKLFE
mmetsp:Transcript_28525/g.60195  ORF Transcript_28525/g.60195 Transcript_28525/m.60195 type:complete len:435 (-) Transcript_28525:237-1541(-)|eukprot:CAMPEP_0183731350 /NCGR_PEP_ID=MMETSP0737-20130205/35171_1 /TAXON_ID=385413 /ORGANISM="Thalassiosira miniscula, Strain CCMP1093" /LENGTH=434 /DNA_ID=CAMNT_0025964059 /DNA_START=33 /DNA_END=1337 /DNA_ORIENTATION=-